MCAQWSAPWGGTVVGDAGPYSDADWSSIWRKFFTADRIVQGVIAHYANELEVTTTGNEVVQVDTGAAIVDGKFYETDAVVGPLGVAKPGAPGDNYYTIILRKDWIGANPQTVRVALYGPVGAPPAAPLYGATQVDGTVWEIPLATVKVHDDGTTTVTDRRKYMPLPSAIACMDRQGGSATEWNTVGTTNYVVHRPLIQCGVIHHIAGNISTVTFPKPFAYKPIVFTLGLLSSSIHCTAEVITTTNFQAWAYKDAAGTENTDDISWMAIGEL